MLEFVRRLIGMKDANTACEAERIVDDVLQFGEIDGWLVTRVDKLRDLDSHVQIYIETPDGTKKWKYPKPYQWDTEENFFARLCEEHGYSRENFNNIVGDRVLVRNKHDGDDRWSLNSTPVEEFRVEREDDEIDVDSDGVTEQESDQAGAQRA